MKISVENLFGITANYELPSRGLSVVVGPNGAGKSVAFVDAFAWGVWGRTTRGTRPRKGARAEFEFEAGGKRIRLARDPRKVAYAIGGKKLRAGETPTKTSARLSEILGMNFETWRRSHVISSRNAALFAEATDAERKALLERLLGFDRFDDPHRRVKDDISELLQRQREREILISSLEREISNLIEDCARAEDEIAQTGRELIDLSDLREQGRKVSIKLAEAMKIESALDTSLIVARDELTAARKRPPVSAAECSTCGQPLPVDGALVDAYNGRISDLRAKIEEISDDLIDARDVDRRLRSQRAKIAAEIAAGERENARTGERSKRAEEALAARLRALKTATRKRDRVQRRLDKSARRLEILHHAEWVLSPRGARPLMLSVALAEISRLATATMTRFGVPVEIELSLGDLRSGARKSAEIRFEVRGFGGEDGYKGASQGQRARVDVATILAIADVARGEGVADLPIVFDEALDGLDEEGREFAADLISSLAIERPVVVITHREELVRVLGGRLISVG